MLPGGEVACDIAGIDDRAGTAGDRDPVSTAGNPGSGAVGQPPARRQLQPVEADPDDEAVVCDARVAAGLYPDSPPAMVPLLLTVPPARR